MEYFKKKRLQEDTTAMDLVSLFRSRDFDSTVRVSTISNQPFEQSK